LLAEFSDAVGETAVRCGLRPPRKAAWGSAVGVFDEDAAGGFDALNAPAGGAEEDDIAGTGVDGEVLVERGESERLRVGG